MTLKISVIYGSVRSDRQGIKAAKFITNELKKRKYEVTLIDPLEYKLPLLDKMHKEYESGAAPENMEKIHKIFLESDAFVIVTAEYNHGPPAALKNILDHFQGEYFFKPSAIVSYSAGPFGGVRAVENLRPILPELGMSSIPSSLPISFVQDAFDKNGVPKDDAYYRRAEKFIKELEWYAYALKVARLKGTPY